MTRQEKAANVVITKCLEISKEESVLIMASEPLMDVAHHLYSACARRTKSTFLTQFAHINPALPMHRAAARMMKEMNIIIAVTSPSLSFTNAMRQASRAGARIANMSDIRMNSFCRIANANFEKIDRRSKKISDILSMAKEVKVSAPNGTDFILSIKKRKGHSDSGFINRPGAFSDLPAGEASILPDEELCEGVLVVDSGMGVNPNGEDQIAITLKEGRAQRISGGPMARKLSQFLSRHSTKSRLVAAFGMGVNDSAQISGFALEDKKVLGTIHLGFGNNVLLGGANTVPVRFDAIAFKATVEIDGRKILQKGKLMLD